MGEGDTIRNSEVRPRHGTAPSESAESGKAKWQSICTAPGSTEGSGVNLKCMYRKARHMRKKWDNLEALALSYSYDVIGISETWWDEFHDWTDGMECYGLFRRDRQDK